MAKMKKGSCKCVKGRRLCKHKTTGKVRFMKGTCGRAKRRNTTTRRRRRRRAA